MAKKKVKKTKKTKKAVKAKKVKKTKKIKKVVKAKKVKKVKKPKKVAKAIKVKKEKVLGRVEHYFDKINVAAISVKAPFKVGDTIHIKGHTTDFFQPIESMQIEHASVMKVKKGDDVGIKIKEHARDHDVVYLAEKGTAVLAKPAKSVKASKPTTPFVQTSIFGPAKIATPPAVKPAVPAPKPEVKPADKPGDPYQQKKFFSF